MLCITVLSRLLPFTGSLEPLEKMTRLQQLWLGANRFSTGLSSLAKLTALTVLKINDNKLTGALANWPLFTCIALLDMSNNQLSGGLLPISSMATLTSLQLYNNKFSGPRAVCFLFFFANHFHYQCYSLSFIFSTSSPLYCFFFLVCFTGSLDPLKNLVFLQELIIYRNELTGRLFIRVIFLFLFVDVLLL